MSVLTPLRIVYVTIPTPVLQLQTVRSLIHLISHPIETCKLVLPRRLLRPVLYVFFSLSSPSMAAMETNSFVRSSKQLGVITAVLFLSSLRPGNHTVGVGPDHLLWLFG